MSCNVAPISSSFRPHQLRYGLTPKQSFFVSIFFADEPRRTFLCYNLFKRSNKWLERSAGTLPDADIRRMVSESYESL